MVHCSEPLLLVARRRWNELENLVRHECSVWQLLSRYIDDIATSDTVTCSGATFTTGTSAGTEMVLDPS
jgi:hypothetical protein